MRAGYVVFTLSIIPEAGLCQAGQRQKIRLLRADSGFFEDQLLSFLEQRQLPYIVVGGRRRS
jgi:hypothetical protein